MVSSQTGQNITRNKDKFESILYDTIETLIDFSTNRSPLSDVNFISTKLEKELKGLILPNGKTWMPVRNVLRIIAKIADEDIGEEKIASIKIDDMLCGCDYFEGSLSYTTDSGIRKGGKYKWKWTAFPGYEKHYDKFIIFSNTIINSEITV